MTAEQQPTDQTRRAPSRRTVAKGAAWAAPVLTGAALAPSIAASPTVCTAASQQTINNALTLATQPSYPLRLDYFQPFLRTNGVAGETWVNLHNTGTGARVLRASAANPIVLEVTVRALPGSGTSGGSRNIYKSSASAWGTVSSPASTYVTQTTPITFTWRITQDIPVGSTADMRLDISVQGLFSNPLVYVTTRMTSFGVNDDVTSANLPALSTLGLGAQTTPCTSYYQAQSQSHIGPDKATYSFLKSGSLQRTPQTWAYGTIADSRNLGNINAGGFGSGEAFDGIW